ncbi:MAG: T9SS type A sorting domain-containing protein, partial [bacterium]
DIDSIICNIPKKPVTKNQNICLEQNSLGLKDFIISEHEILWYDSLTSKNGKKTPPSMPNSSGKFIYYVTTKDQCENGEKAILEINVFPIPSPPTIIKDTANHLITNVGGITWYKDGVKISDTTQKLKPTTNGLYSATTTQNGCISSISQTYFYLINFITNLSNGEYFRFYPNPTSGDVKIDYYLNASIELFIYINDFNGRSIISNQKIKSGNKINIGRVASGNYFAIVKDKEGRLITIQKVVKE